MLNILHLGSMIFKKYNRFFKAKKKPYLEEFIVFLEKEAYLLTASSLVLHHSNLTLYITLVFQTILIRYTTFAAIHKNYLFSIDYFVAIISNQVVSHIGKFS